MCYKKFKNNKNCLNASKIENEIKTLTNSEYNLEKCNECFE